MGVAPRAAVATIVSTTAFVLAACSLGNFTGYTGGVDNEAGANEGGGGGPDEAGGGSDAGAGGDATADDDANADAGGDGGCGGVFCDGFERVLVDTLYDYNIRQAGSVLTTDTNDKKVGARSLRTDTTTDPGARAFVEKDFTSTAGHASMAFWLKMTTPARVIQLARIRVDGPNGTAGNFYLQTKANGGMLVGEQFYDGANFVGTSSHDIGAAFQPDTWQYWKLEIDATVEPPKGKVTVDDMLVRNDSLTNTFVPGAVHVYVGTMYAETGPAISMYFDELKVDFSP